MRSEAALSRVQLTSLEAAMVQRYFKRLWQLLLAVPGAIALMVLIDVLETGGISLTADDLPALAWAALAGFVMALFLALFPGLFDPVK